MGRGKRPYLGFPPNPLWGMLFVPALALMAGIAIPIVSNLNIRATDTAQQALFVAIEEGLQVHYASHGHFPEDINALTLVYPDGVDVSLMGDLDYVASTSGYRLRMTCVSGNVLESSKKTETIR